MKYPIEKAIKTVCCNTVKFLLPISCIKKIEIRTAKHTNESSSLILGFIFGVIHFFIKNDEIKKITAIAAIINIHSII